MAPAPLASADWKFSGLLEMEELATTRGLGRSSPMYRVERSLIGPPSSPDPAGL
jgi:hypothetical protein